MIVLRKNEENNLFSLLAKKRGNLFKKLDVVFSLVAMVTICEPYDF